METPRLVSLCALQIDPDPRNAAAHCLTAGILLLSYCQSHAPIPDPDAMLDEVFDNLRIAFHAMTKPERADA